MSEPVVEDGKGKEVKQDKRKRGLQNVDAILAKRLKIKQLLGEWFPKYCVILQDRRGKVSTYRTQDFPTSAVKELLAARTKPLGEAEMKKMKDKFPQAGAGWDEFNKDTARTFVRALGCGRLGKHILADEACAGTLDQWLKLGTTTQLEAQPAKGNAAGERILGTAGKYASKVEGRNPRELMEPQSWQASEMPSTDPNSVCISKRELCGMKIEVMAKVHCIAIIGLCLEYLNPGHLGARKMSQKLEDHFLQKVQTHDSMASVSLSDQTAEERRGRAAVTLTRAQRDFFINSLVFPICNMETCPYNASSVQPPSDSVMEEDADGEGHAIEEEEEEEEVAGGSSAAGGEKKAPIPQAKAFDGAAAGGGVAVLAAAAGGVQALAQSVPKGVPPVTVVAAEGLPVVQGVSVEAAGGEGGGVSPQGGIKDDSKIKKRPAPASVPAVGGVGGVGGALGAVAVQGADKKPKTK